MCKAVPACLRAHHPPTYLGGFPCPVKLTERQRRFIEAYLASRNAKQAALDAGYSPRWPEMSSHQVLALPPIRAALRARGLDPPQGAHPRTQRRKPMVRPPRKELSIREERFALAYLVTGNAALAARRAGIPGAQSHGEGYRLLNRPRVAAFIEAERAASIERTRIDADRVKREFARIAFMDIADIIEWDEDASASCASRGLATRARRKRKKRSDRGRSDQLSAIRQGKPDS